MYFIIITFFAAFLIEGLGTLVSVIGLSTLFGANLIIIVLAIALDIGKLTVVSLLYTYWNKLGRVMRSYALIAAVVTMTITSAGAAGYLSGEFQKAIMGTQEGSLKVDVLKQQQAKYEERKKQIDSQIATLPEKTTVAQRLRLMNGFKAEQNDLQAKITEIDKQLPELQIKQIGVEAKAGPILYISKAFDIPVESAVKWVILLIIFVFDPLAVFLIIAGNFLLHERRTHHDQKVSEADLFAEPEPEREREVKSTVEPEPQPELELKSVIQSEPAAEELTLVPVEQLATHEPEHVPLDDLPPVHSTLLDDAPAIFQEVIEEPIGEQLPPPPTVFIEPLTSPDRFVLDDIQVPPNSPPWVETPDATADVQMDLPVVTDEPIVVEEQMQPATPEALPEVSQEREQITLSQLKAKPIPHASLLDGPVDDSIQFDENPRATASGTMYNNLR